MFWLNTSERVKSKLSCKLSTFTYMYSKSMQITNMYAKFNNQLKNKCIKQNKFIDEIHITTSNIYHEWQCRVYKDLVPIWYLCRSLSRNKYHYRKAKDPSYIMKDKRIRWTKCLLVLVSVSGSSYKYIIRKIGVTKC